MSNPTSRQFCRRTRREFLWETGCGFGALGLSALLDGDGFFASKARASESKFVNPMAPKKSHFPAKAKACIFVFCYGGPSHIETFDYKPKLYPLDGKTIPVKHVRPGRAEERRPRGRAEVAVQALWPVRQNGVRPVAAYRQLRRRHRLRAFDVRRVAHPRLGDADDELRPAAQRPSLARLVGHLRTRQRQRKLARLRRHAR